MNSATSRKIAMQTLTLIVKDLASKTAKM
jgi:hypothetical protein